MKREEEINKIIKEEKLDTNLISDGYHTFGELYDHRISLFISLCKAIDDRDSLLLEQGEILPKQMRVWKSKRHSDGELAFSGEWFVLGIGEEKGKQITYHLPISEWENTQFIREMELAPEWDGHTPQDVLNNLANTGKRDMRYKNKKFLSELWLEEYDGKDGMCLLCIHNSGLIQTRDGKKYCICPNGRTRKSINTRQKRMKVCKCECHKIEKTATGCIICYKAHLNKKVKSPTFNGHL